jgi:hypothetical protein
MAVTERMQLICFLSVSLTTIIEMFGFEYLVLGCTVDGVYNLNELDQQLSCLCRSCLHVIQD